MFDGTAESSKNNNPFAKYSGYMLLIIIICIPWIITLQSENSDLKDELEVANETIAEMDEEIFNLQEQNSAWEVNVDELCKELEESEDLNTRMLSENYDLWEQCNFFDQYAGIVTVSGKKYHTYNCYHWQTGSDFWIYNIDAAEANGYEPCLDCH